jgi:lysophospholipase L1-like esterase
MAKSAYKRRDTDTSPPGSVGQRIFGGRMGTYDNTTASTFQVACELPTHFDAIQVVLANTQTRFTDQAVTVKAGVVGDVGDINTSGAGFVTVTKGTLTRVASQVAWGSNRISYTLTDMVALKSIPRTDGGTRPLLVIRAQFASNAALPVTGNGTDSFTNWASRAGNRWIMRVQTGDATTTFTSTTNISQSPIVGVRFLTRGRVVNVVAVGDSITDGRGTYLGEGFVMPACEALTSDRLAVCYSNAGWSGQQTGMYLERAIDIVQQLRPDVLVIPAHSPNDETTTITEAGIAASVNRRGRVLDECARYGVRPVLWTMLPVNTAVNPYGTSDALRVALNNDTLALRDRGVLVADTSAAVSGSTSGGQVQLADGTNTDGIHPNSAGNAILADVLKPVLARAIGV